METLDTKSKTERKELKGLAKLITKIALATVATGAAIVGGALGIHHLTKDTYWDLPGGDRVNASQMYVDGIRADKMTPDMKKIKKDGPLYLKYNGQTYVVTAYTTEKKEREFDQGVKEGKYHGGTQVPRSHK